MAAEKMVDCPECGIRVKKGNLSKHMRRVHGSSEPALDGAPAKEGGFPWLWVGVAAVLLLLVGAGLYPFLIHDDDGNDDGDGGSGRPRAVIKTNMGNIVVELYTEEAPITTKNFMDLAIDGKYDDTIFHRISPDFMIQGGDFTNHDGTGGHAAEYHAGLGDPEDESTWVIPDEFHLDLRNVRGAISMANAGPDTGGSQFFLLVADYPSLDDKHAVFGFVVDGIGIVDAISELPHDGAFDPSPGGGHPIDPVTVSTISIIS